MGDSRATAFYTKWSDGGEQKASSSDTHNLGEALEDIAFFSQIASAWSGISCRSAFGGDV